jgi:hypothetical protein
MKMKNSQSGKRYMGECHRVIIHVRNKRIAKSKFGNSSSEKY